MKRPLISLITFALVFALVLSCNEQDESPTAKDAVTSGSVSASQNRNSKNARTGEIIFDGSEGDPIDYETAKKWAANYRATLENPDDIRGHFFGFEAIQQLLNESSCVGIRIYYALDETGNKKLLLVGVDASGEDLLPSASEALDGGGNIILDFSFPCPDYCSGGGLSDN